jgi:hypothetical protein
LLSYVPSFCSQSGQFKPLSFYVVTSSSVEETHLNDQVVALPGDLPRRLPGLHLAPQFFLLLMVRAAVGLDFRVGGASVSGGKFRRRKLDKKDFL